MFKQRSYQKELLDAEFIPKADLFQNLKELHTINRLLGGYAISLSALKRLLGNKKSYSLVDIGSGGGDTVKEIYRWNKKQKIEAKLYGIDLKQTCVDYSNSNNPISEITFICDDYRQVFNHVAQVDFIHACLFCHHLMEDDIVQLIQFAQEHKTTLIINDLERNRFAYYAIRLLTRLFSKSYLVKNDAPLSVLRGFKKEEWLHLLKRSRAKNYSVTWRWAFRHEIIVYANEN
ncbi:MAG: methyltransferase domain-containing protein [Bacteroidia bacterium]